MDARTPLSTWFWAAYLVSGLTPGMSAVQFQRQLGLTRYETAFAILHKLPRRDGRPDRDPIGAGTRGKLDEVWIGGRTRGEAGAPPQDARDRRGRGACPTAGDAPDPINARWPRRGNKRGRLPSPVVKNRKGRWTASAGRARTSCTARRSRPTIGVATTGSCDEGPSNAGRAERARAVAEEYLPLIHLVYSNLKAWINGVHHGVGPQHLQGVPQRVRGGQPRLLPCSRASGRCPGSQVERRADLRRAFQRRMRPQRGVVMG